MWLRSFEIQGSSYLVAIKFLGNCNYNIFIENLPAMHVDADI